MEMIVCVKVRIMYCRDALEVLLIINHCNTLFIQFYCSIENMNLSFTKTKDIHIVGS